MNLFEIYNPNTAVRYGDVAWIDGYEGQLLVVPLCNCISNYNENMAAVARPVMLVNEEDGSKKIVAEYLEDEETLKFINVVRNQHKRYILKQSPAWYHKYHNWRKYEEDEVREAEEHSLNVKNGSHGGSRSKRWNGCVVDPVIPEVKVEEREQRKTDKLAAAKYQLELLETQEKINTIVKSRSHPDEELEEKDDWTKVLLEDQFGVKYDDEKLLSRHYSHKVCAPYLQLGTSHTVKNRVDKRAHGERTGAMFSDQLTYMNCWYVDQELEEREFKWFAKPWELFLKWIELWCYVWWYLFGYAMFACVVIKRYKKNKFSKAVIVRELYDELLSRKVVGIGKEAHVVYERMKAKYSNYTTLNIPVELSRSHVLENTFKAAWKSYCAKHKIVLENFLQELDESSETSGCSMDIIEEMFSSRFLSQSRTLPAWPTEPDWQDEMESAHPMLSTLTRIINHICRKPYQLVLSLVTMLVPCQAVLISLEQNVDSLNGWQLFLAILTIVTLKACADALATISFTISDPSQQTLISRWIHGWIKLITLLNVVMNLEASDNLLPWILDVMKALLIYSASTVLIVLLSRSRILTTNIIALFLAVVIMLSVYSVQLPKLLNPKCIPVMNHLLSSMYPSESGADISVNVTDQVTACWSQTSHHSNAILMPGSWRLLNLSYIVICYQILRRIMDSIYQRSLVLTDSLEFYCKIMTCAFWVKSIHLLLRACRGKCLLHLAMDSPILLSQSTSLSHREYISLDVLLKVMMDSFSYMAQPWRTSRIQKIWSHVVSHSSMKYIQHYTWLGSVVSNIIHIPIIITETLLNHLLESDGSILQALSISTLKLMDVLKPSAYHYYMNPSVAPYYNHLRYVAYSCSEMLRRTSASTSVTGIAAQWSDTIGVLSKMQLVGTSPNWIASLLLASITYLLMNSWRLKMNLRELRHWKRCYLVLESHPSSRGLGLIVGERISDGMLGLYVKDKLLAPWILVEPTMLVKWMTQSGSLSEAHRVRGLERRATTLQEYWSARQKVG